MSIPFRFVVRDGDPTRARVEIECTDPATQKKRWTCSFPCSTDRPLEEGHLWRWDGNTERPTVSPSIACQSPGCRLHFSLIAGEIK
jgi:hypothetical protein